MRRTPRSLPFLAVLAVLSAGCAEEPPPSAPGASPTTPSAPGAAAPTPEEALQRGIVPPPPLFSADVDPAWFERPPGERAPLDGLDGFSAVSMVEMSAAPGVPYRLDVTHVFPDRTRWALAIPGAPERGRSLEYRYGGHRFRHESAHLASRELEGENLENGLRQMDLRIALMLYPAHLEWEPDPETGEAVARLSDERGTLRAELDPEGRPVALTAYDADGERQETIRIDSRQEIDGREWPKDLVIEAEGEVVWRERLKDVSTRLTLLDRYFIPVDYSALPEGEVDLTQPRLVDLPPMTVREIPLPPSSSWTDSLAAARDARDAVLVASPGIQLEPRTSFKLARGPVPSSFLLRLESGPPPAGWETVPARRGATLFVREPVRLEKQVGQLQEALPPDARPQVPYVTYHPADEAPPRFQVILPFD